MNYIDISSISLLLVGFYIYWKAYTFFFKNESKKFLKWGYAIFITGIFFILLSLGFNSYSEQVNEEYSIGYSIGITLFLWLIVHSLLNKDTSHHFRASKNDNKFPPEIEYQKVSTSFSDFIPIYPRVTIHDLEHLDEYKNPIHLFFDSSDYSVINNALGSFEGRQESFLPGREFKLNDDLFIAERVEVDFMNVFDDYSGYFGHTNVYKGKDIPYNIQIIVFARRTNK